MMKKIKTWKQIVIDTLFPRFCLICNKRLGINEKDVCISCFCNMPFTHFKGEKGNVIERLTCDDIICTKRANSFFFYEKESSYCTIFFHFKYYNHPEVAVTMGHMMAQELKDTDFFNDIDVIVPIPLSKERLKKRGYNQSERLARGISQVTGIPIDTTSVIRTVNNPTQTHLDAIQRNENVKDIFALSANENIHDKHILLVDDVITTGSTTRACAHAALKAPNIKISIISLACSSYHKKYTFPSAQRR